MGRPEICVLLRSVGHIYREMTIIQGLETQFNEKDAPTVKMTQVEGCQ